MSNFEKSGVIFVTGLVAVILAMSFFGTGHEPAEDIQAKAEGQEDGRLAGDSARDTRRDSGTRSSFSTPSGSRHQAPDEPSWGSPRNEPSRELAIGPANEDRSRRSDRNRPASPRGSGTTTDEERKPWMLTPQGRPTAPPLEGGRGTADPNGTDQGLVANGSDKASAGGIEIPSNAPEGNTPQTGTKEPATPNVEDLWAASNATPPVGEESKQTTPAATKKNATKTTPAKRKASETIPPRKERDVVPKKALASGTSYKIRPGDTLSEIAQKQLGTARAWKQIVQANPGLDANRLPVGKSITLPTSSKGSVASAKTKPAPKSGKKKNASTKTPTKSKPKATTGDRYYTVAKGDTLSGIAQSRLKSTGRWREIYDLNRDRLPSESTLPIGTRLRMPE